MKILVVEDELDLLQSLAEGLRLSGYVVDTASDGEAAEELIYVETYDLVILDINLPKRSGFSVLEEVRKYNKEVNIIMLTARSDVEDRVSALDMGANDYLLKPFYFEELEARIRSLLRRKSFQQDSQLRCGRLVFDTSSRKVTIDGNELSLTRKELGILEYLLLNQGRHISSEELIEHVWEGDSNSFSGTVRVHIASLRKKLKTLLGHNIIHNVIGKGYIIEDET
ncbi:response regulator transcription factor [Streptococcus saliviloxodontae]|uniref:DNA-binding response OmpR family regulator n=1 Tax=Streptococcus saliviloxodontae TaxID=1349416 RepID=A0ABS2PN31_9STRE|nr:response regulator transcription factor [Streptococcus saliviloxodontae]MBM7636764.1 DNA-binding response OmpR family regulator [Streptococcus saliviloxodontae]